MHIRGCASRNANLPNTRFSMTEISQILGSRPQRLLPWFSQHFGSSPTEWRSAALDGSANGHRRELPHDLLAPR